MIDFGGHLHAPRASEAGGEGGGGGGVVERWHDGSDGLCGRAFVAAACGGLVLEDGGGGGVVERRALRTGVGSPGDVVAVGRLVGGY